MQINSVYYGIPKKNKKKSILTFLYNNELIINEIANSLCEYNIYCTYYQQFVKWNSNICNKPNNVFISSIDNFTSLVDFDAVITYNDNKQQELAHKLKEMFMLPRKNHAIINLVYDSSIINGLINKQIIINNLFGENHVFTSPFIARSWGNELTKILMFGNNEKRFTAKNKKYNFLIYIDNKILGYQPNLNWIQNFIRNDSAKIITTSDFNTEGNIVEKVNYKEIEKYMEDSTIFIDLSFDSYSIFSMKAIRRNCAVFSNTETFCTKNFNTDISSANCSINFSQQIDAKIIEKILDEQNELLDTKHKTEIFQSILQSTMEV